MDVEPAKVVQDKKKKVTPWGLYIVLGVIAYLWLHPTENKKIEKDNAQQESIIEEAASKWHYSSTEDSMNGKSQYNATCFSMNEISFGFPYQGAQRAALQLRTHPRYGKNVILSITKGQFLCRYNGCGVLVRFDDNQPIRFTASEPADNDSTVLFINNYSNFISRMMKAKKVRIEAEFYQEGTRVFEFDVSDFDSNQYLGK